MWEANPEGDGPLGLFAALAKTRYLGGEKRLTDMWKCKFDLLSSRIDAPNVTLDFIDYYHDDITIEKRLSDGAFLEGMHAFTVFPTNLTIRASSSEVETRIWKDFHTRYWQSKTWRSGQKPTMTKHKTTWSRCWGSIMNMVAVCVTIWVWLLYCCQLFQVSRSWRHLYLSDAQHYVLMVHCNLDPVGRDVILIEMNVTLDVLLRWIQTWHTKSFKSRRGLEMWTTRIYHILKDYGLTNWLAKKRPKLTPEVTAK